MDLLTRPAPTAAAYPPDWSALRGRLALGPYFISSGKYFLMLYLAAWLRCRLVAVSGSQLPGGLGPASGRLWWLLFLELCGCGCVPGVLGSEHSTFRRCGSLQAAWRTSLSRCSRLAGWGRPGLGAIAALGGGIHTGATASSVATPGRVLILHRALAQGSVHRLVPLSGMVTALLARLLLSGMAIAWWNGRPP